MNSTTPTITVRRINEPKYNWERLHPIEISGGCLGTQKINLSDEQVRILGGMLAVIRDRWTDNITDEWPHSRALEANPPQPKP